MLKKILRLLFKQVFFDFLKEFIILMPMKIQDYDFELPERLIAKYPEEQRDQSRLLVVNKNNGTYKENKFSDIENYFNEGDCLVLNESPVFPARIYGESMRRNSIHEFVLVDYLGDKKWKVLINKSRKCKVGDQFKYLNKMKAVILEKQDGGVHIIEFDKDLNVKTLYDIGQMALPPYILKLREHIEEDKHTYQTVYHKKLDSNTIPTEGSVAAPTAGLHFTEKLLDNLKKKDLF